MDQGELLARIDLIERMVLEGRRKTQYWGWSFLLWGSGHLVAMAWQVISGKPGVAWGVTMSVCAAITAVIASTRKSSSPTLSSRALGGVWFGMGISISLLAALGLPFHTLQPESFVAVFFVLTGAAHFASSQILQWRVQLFLGLIWWGAAVLALVGPREWIGWTFIVMALFGEVGFGLYLMAKEKADLRHARAA
jgi:hypothetical protein